MDVVYLVRRGNVNEELRFSLRSLVNLPHDRVWTVGYKPNWLTGVEHIPGNRCQSKWLNVYDNLRIAASEVEADEFIVMNDDFFVVNPVAGVPTRHRGYLIDHISSVGSGSWKRSLMATFDFLRANGFRRPLSYDLHIPITMEREKLGEVLEIAWRKSTIPVQWRSLYGNWWRVPSTLRRDVKVRRAQIKDEWGPGADFVSTDDYSFGRAEVGAWLRQRFPDKSEFEK